MVKRAWVAAKPLVVGLVATGCASAPEIRLVKPAVETQDQVRISIKNESKWAGPDEFSFEVRNLSKETLVVERDAVKLVTPKGTLRRTKGEYEGYGSQTYVIRPFGIHALNVK